MSSYTQLKQLAKSIGRRLPFTITLNLAVPGTPFGFSIHRKRTHTIQAHNEPSDTLALAQLTRAEYFHTSINKTRFERGENVFFSITFRGQLRYGYYEAVIVRSDNSVDYSWDPQTLPYARAETRGTLSGPIQQDEHAWSYPLPM